MVTISITSIRNKKDLLQYKRLLMNRLEQDLVEPEAILLSQILQLKELWGSIEDRSGKQAKLLRKVREFLLSSPILGTVANHREHSFLNLFK
jgi:hypothetical protein